MARDGSGSELGEPLEASYRSRASSHLTYYQNLARNKHNTADLNPLIDQPIFALGIVPTHVQDLVFREVYTDPPLKVPLDGIASLQLFTTAWWCWLACLRSTQSHNLVEWRSLPEPCRGKGIHSVKVLFLINM